MLHERFVVVMMLAVAGLPAGSARSHAQGATPRFELSDFRVTAQNGQREARASFTLKYNGKNPIRIFAGRTGLGMDDDAGNSWESSSLRGIATCNRGGAIRYCFQSPQLLEQALTYATTIDAGGFISIAASLSNPGTPGSCGDFAILALAVGFKEGDGQWRQETVSRARVPITCGK